MIDRKHFGKRVGAQRRRLGMTQGDLAQALAVTAQAVSKWERGESLPDPELLLALSHLTGRSINALLEDRDPLTEMGLPGETRDGVRILTGSRDLSAYDPFVRMLRQEKAIRKNWERSALPGHPLAEGGAKIAGRGGLILEIGAGPGGGFMPHVLRSDPEASVVVTDLIPGVLAEWKRFLDAELGSPNLWYAACDFTALPFPDGVFDTVADGGGIANAIGDKKAALREAYRVLKPGGALFTYGLFVTEETAAALPPDILSLLRREYPDAFCDLYDATVPAGFGRIESDMSPGRPTDRDDSGFAARCRELGVNVPRTAFVRACFKG